MLGDHQNFTNFEKLKIKACLGSVFVSMESPFRMLRDVILNE